MGSPSFVSPALFLAPIMLHTNTNYDHGGYINTIMGMLQLIEAFLFENELASLGIILDESSKDPTWTRKIRMCKI